MLNFAKLSQLSKFDVSESLRGMQRSSTSSLGDKSAALPAVLVAVGYFLGTQVGFALTPKSGPISTFWPPNAILLAALLLVPRKRWWTLVLAVLPAHLLVQLPRGIPLGTSLGWFLGNTGEALLGAYLITEVQEAKVCFERVRGLLVFIAFGVVGAPLLTSFLDAGVVIATGLGKDYWLLLTTRLLSNMLAQLTLVPVIVLFSLYGVDWIRKATIDEYLEATLLLVSVFFVTAFAFGLRYSGQVQVRYFYLLLPVLLWASLRFEFGGLSATLLAVSFLLAWGSIHGFGPFLSVSLRNVMTLQVFLCAISLPFMFLGVVLSQQRVTEQSLRDSRLRLIDSQEKERRRIARELHDGVGQSLALLQIELSQLEVECDPPMQSKLEDLARKVSDVSNVTREISHGLHPSHLEYLGLSRSLDKLCREFAQDRLLDIEFVKGELPEHLDPEVSLSLYRVAQEALHNAAKYSRARHVEVRLRMKAGRLWMEIVDDGVGLAARRNDQVGMGMESMRERMELVGGAISIESAPMKGTKVRASVSLVRTA
jgi:signal transduction histidine kinase